MNFSDTFRPLQENDEIFDWIPLYEEHLRNEPIQVGSRLGRQAVSK